MDILSPAEQDQEVASSSIARLYNEEIDRESAYEILNKKISASEKAKEENSQQEEKTIEEKTSSVGDTIKNIANSSIAKTIFREVTRGLLGVLIGKPTRSSKRKSFF
jgi:hypothetical protein